MEMVLDHARLNTGRYSYGLHGKTEDAVRWFHMHVTFDLARVDSVTTTMVLSRLPASMDDEAIQQLVITKRRDR